MERMLSRHSTFVRAVTRVDGSGVIVHTIPIVESALGADISSQEHMVEVLRTHEPVFSDAFFTVQGYWAVAYHMPVFSEDSLFMGTLAAVIPFRAMIQNSFCLVQSDERQSAWMISQDGRILYSDLIDEIGLSVLEVYADHPGFLEVVEASAGSREGSVESEFPIGLAAGLPAVSMLSTYYPVRFTERYWTIILSTPIEDILAGISGFRNSLLLGVAVFVLAILLYLFLKIRALITRSEQRKWNLVVRDRDLLAASVEQAREVVLITDSDGRVTYVNPAVERISGIPVDDFIGESIEHNFDEETSKGFGKIETSVGATGGWSGIIDAACRNGTRFKMDLTISPVRDREGIVVNYVIVGRDVTIQLEMEKHLRERQKMEAIGLLAGGIAHDFNNLVTAILGYADLLTSNYPAESGAGKAGEVIKSAAYRASELTDQLLGFARRGKQQIEKVSLSRSVQNVSKLLSRILDARISVQLDLDEDVTVMGDPVQIEQMILNLAVNSKDAMPDGGTLSYSLEKRSISRIDPAKRSDFQEGNYAVLSVSDSGTGIPEDIQARIFEPFFTTKPEGYGSGMGLATVYGIVENHGGWIDLESSAASGTTFTIFIPLASDEDAVAHTAADHEDTVSGGSGCVLVVDDELVVLSTAEEMLRNLGYCVFTASNGEKALTIYRKYGTSIDLVLMDLAMPGMDGRECFTRLREINPDVRVILSSGYGREGRAQQLLDAGVLAFLRKPYGLAELAEILKEYL